MARKLPRLETPLEKEKRAFKEYIDRDEQWYKDQLFNNDELGLTKEDILDEYSTNKVQQKTASTGDWDVLKDYEIVYFDPNLSYEITGYRPINEEQGLDFDPSPFNEVARLYDREGSYTKYPQNSKPFRNFWDEQKRRCKEGYTVGKYRITGDHYFFLNFYRMQSPNIDKNKKTGGRNESFPSFLSKQYEFFHYFEMCEILGMDALMLKARGLGFSEIMACLGARPFMTMRHYRSVFTCAADAQLDPLLDKCWFQLNWLNYHTNGGMIRHRQKVDNAYQKRASLVDKEGVEFGNMSEIEGIVADDPRKVRGDRTERLIIDEGGSNKQLIKTWIQGNALVELGGVKVGVKVTGGTGGDSGPQLAGLAKMFNNPEGYGVLPFRHSYTRDGKPTITGFFIPAHTFSLNPEYLDSRGVTDSKRFREFYETKRAKLIGDDLITYSAEHCMCPEEALLKQGDNMFDTEAITQRLIDIKVNKGFTKPKHIHLDWDKSVGNGLQKVKAVESQISPLLVVEPPILDETGNVYKNLYVAGIDSIDMGKKDSALDNDVSDFCIVIKKRVFGTEDPKYVAMYKYRPNDIRTAYDVAMKLLTWYNCKAMLEYTKISIQTYFREKGKANLFMSRPEFAVSNSTRKKGYTKNLVGVPGTEAVIRHQLELIASFVIDYSHTIDFEEVLDQMLNYSYDNKRKFDIIAALGMAELGDEDLSGVTPTRIQTTSNQWEDFGYYTDENGYKRKGVIPKNKRW